MKTLQSIFSNVFLKAPVLKIIISFVIFIIALVLTDNTDNSFYVLYIGLPALCYFALLFIIGVIYAWIINPLKDRKK